MFNLALHIAWTLQAWILNKIDLNRAATVLKPEEVFETVFIKFEAH